MVSPSPLPNGATWAKAKYQRRDFRLDVLTGSSNFSEEGSLFAHLGKHEIFTPVKTYPPMTVRELAGRRIWSRLCEGATRQSPNSGIRTQAGVQHEQEP
jgi:hypothetical protein